MKIGHVEGENLHPVNLRGGGNPSILGGRLGSCTARLGHQGIGTNGNVHVDGKNAFSMKADDFLVPSLKARGFGGGAAVAQPRSDVTVRT